MFNKKAEAEMKAYENKKLAEMQEKARKAKEEESKKKENKK